MADFDLKEVVSILEDKIGHRITQWLLIVGVAALFCFLFWVIYSYSLGPTIQFVWKIIQQQQFEISFKEDFPAVLSVTSLILAVVTGIWVKSKLSSNHHANNVKAKIQPPKNSELHDHQAVIRQDGSIDVNGLGFYPSRDALGENGFTLLAQLEKCEKAWAYWVSGRKETDGLSPDLFMKIEKLILPNPASRSVDDLRTSLEYMDIYKTLPDEIKNTTRRALNTKSDDPNKKEIGIIYLMHVSTTPRIS